MKQIIFFICIFSILLSQTFSKSNLRQVVITKDNAGFQAELSNIVTRNPTISVTHRLDAVPTPQKESNTIEISNFYDYTKSCMKIIAEIQKTKEKYPKPKKVELKNIDLKKNLAVFDLDETLIHCVVKDYKDCKNIIKITMPSTNHVATIGVNIRPNWEEDIKRISLLYNIVIYTRNI